MVDPDPKVIVVLALYSPTVDVLETIHSAATQAPVIAVDDGSGQEFDGVLDRLEPELMQLIRLDRNYGIAKALNSGVEAALASGADYVLTLDQDSKVSGSMVSVLVDDFARFGAETRVAAVGPGKIDGLRSDGTGGYVGVAGPQPWLVSVAEALQSGLLFPARVLRALGGFDESLVIDGVDTEYCLRARQRGYRVYVDTRVEMHHRLGAGTEAKTFQFGPWQPIVTEHSARRRYYITRNRLRLLRRYLAREPRWATVYLRRLIVSSAFAVTIEADRAAKMRAILAGARDAITGRDGYRR